MNAALPSFDFQKTSSQTCCWIQTNVPVPSLTCFRTCQGWDEAWALISCWSHLALFCTWRSLGVNISICSGVMVSGFVDVKPFVDSHVRWNSEKNVAALQIEQRSICFGVLISSECKHSSRYCQFLCSKVARPCREGWNASSSSTTICVVWPQRTKHVLFEPNQMSVTLSIMRGQRLTGTHGFRALSQMAPALDPAEEPAWVVSSSFMCAKSLQETCIIQIYPSCRCRSCTWKYLNFFWELYTWSHL